MLNSHSDPKSLVQLLVDGEIDAAQHASLFAMLAKDDDLRHIFDSGMRIQRAAFADAQGMAIPSANTAAIFAKAGYTTAASTATQLLPALRWSNLASPLAAIALGVLTFFGLRYYDQQHVRFPENSYALSATTGNARATSQSSGLSALNLNSTQESRSALSAQNATSSSSSTSQHQQAPRVITRYIAIVDDEQKLAEHLDADATLSTEHTQSTALSALSKAELNSHYAQSAPATERFQSASAQVQPVFRKAERLSIQVRRLCGLGFANGPGFNPSAQSASANMAFSLSMKGLDRSYWGLELGQEELLNYQQSQAESKERYATLTYAALSYRFEFGDYYDQAALRPYAQCMLGGSQYGGVLKIALGLDCHLGFGISLIGGVETTMAQYRYQSAYQSISKTGIFGGLNYAL